MSAPLRYCVLASRPIHIPVRRPGSGRPRRRYSRSSADVAVAKRRVCGAQQAAPEHAKRHPGACSAAQLHPRIGRGPDCLLLNRCGLAIADLHSLSNGVRCSSFARRRANSRSSRLRRKGVSLSQSPISAAVLPQPRHHPVFASSRQTSMHGDCARLAPRFMEEPRLEFPVRAHDGVRQSERLIRPTKPLSVPSARCCPSADQASAVTAPLPGRLTTTG